MKKKRDHIVGGGGGSGSGGTCFSLFSSFNNHYKSSYRTDCPKKAELPAIEKNEELIAS